MNLGNIFKDILAFLFGLTSTTNFPNTSTPKHVITTTELQGLISHETTNLDLSTIFTSHFPDLTKQTLNTGETDVTKYKDTTFIDTSRTPLTTETRVTGKNKGTTMPTSETDGYKSSKAEGSTTTIQTEGNTTPTNENEGSTTSTTETGGSTTTTEGTTPPTNENEGSTTTTSETGGTATTTSETGGTATPTSETGGTATPTSETGGTATPTSETGGTGTTGQTEETTTHTDHTTTSSPKPKSKGLTKGQIAGIVIGVLLLVGVLAALAVIFLRRRSMSEDRRPLTA